MSKIITIDSKTSREKILSVFEDFENLVCPTMGYGGENVLITNSSGVPYITKDGVSVANAISYDDETKEIIAEIIKQAAKKTNENAGDGTTTATCIAVNLYRYGLSQLNTNINFSEFYKEIENATETVLNRLNEMKVVFDSKPKEEIRDILYKIAMISTNGDENVSKLIATAFTDGGKDAVITVESGSSGYSVKNVEGTKISTAGIIHPGFLEKEIEKKVELKDCYILMTTQEMESAEIINSLTHILTPIIKSNKSLLIITPKADKGFLANMINNKNKGHLKNCVIKAPYFGLVGKQFLQDIRAYVGGRIIEENDSFLNVKTEDLGYIQRAEVTPWHTTFYGPERSKIDDKLLAERINILEKKMQTLSPSDLSAEKVQERLATLLGKVFKITVPSTSEVEDGERADRIEDALNACRGAYGSGYLPGCGIALMIASSFLDEKKIGEKIMKQVCIAPFQQILKNAKESPELIQEKLFNLNENEILAYDLRTKKIGKCLEIGIIDSHKVIKEALTNGVSVSKTLLTTRGIIANKKQEGQQMPYMPY